MKSSRIFFEMVKSGKFQLVTSVVVRSELSFAPPGVRMLFNRLAKVADMAAISNESLALRNAYVKAEIVSENCLDDALHVALATVSGCGLIVSGTSSISSISRKFRCIMGSTEQMDTRRSASILLWR